MFQGILKSITFYPIILLNFLPFHYPTLALVIELAVPWKSHFNDFESFYSVTLTQVLFILYFSIPATTTSTNTQTSQHAAPHYPSSKTSHRDLQTSSHSTAHTLLQTLYGISSLRLMSVVYWSSTCYMKRKMEKNYVKGYREELPVEWTLKSKSSRQKGHLEKQRPELQQGTVTQWGWIKAAVRLSGSFRYTTDPRGGASSIHSSHDLAYTESYTQLGHLPAQHSSATMCLWNQPKHLHAEKDTNAHHATRAKKDLYNVNAAKVFFKTTTESRVLLSKPVSSHSFLTLLFY